MLIVKKILVSKDLPFWLDLMLKNIFRSFKIFALWKFNIFNLKIEFSRKINTVISVILFFLKNGRKMFKYHFQIDFHSTLIFLSIFFSSSRLLKACDYRVKDRFLPVHKTIPLIFYLLHAHTILVSSSSFVWQVVYDLISHKFLLLSSLVGCCRSNLNL